MTEDNKMMIEPLINELVDFSIFCKSDLRAVKIKTCLTVPKSNKLLQLTVDDGSGIDRTILSGARTFYEPEDLVGKKVVAILNLPPRKIMGITSCGMLISTNYIEDGEQKFRLLFVDNSVPIGARFC